MKKLKILLLNPPYNQPIIRDNYCCFTSKSGYLWPPIDFLYLSAILGTSKIELKVIDAVVEKMSFTILEEKIKNLQPEVIIALTGTASFKDDLFFLKKIKKLKKPNIFLMGNIVSFKTKQILDSYSFVDGIIHNFYDNSIKDFFLEGKLSPSITIRRNKKVIYGQINVFKPLTMIKLKGTPQFNLFPLSLYQTPFMRNKPMVTMMTSFGCPFHCKFCVASSLSYYYRDLVELENEFNELKKIGIKEIFFEDSTFNAYLPYTKNILNLMIEKNYQFSWAANIHSFNVDEKLLVLMKKAGCHTIQIGVESGSESILKNYAPSKKIDQLKKVFKIAKKVGIKTLGYFIIGFPEETKQKAQRTIDFAKELDPNFVSFSVLTPDFGTKLYEELKSKKIIDNKLYQFDSSGKAFIRNSKFSLKWQNYYIKKAYIDFYLRPKKIFSYLSDYKNLFRYIKNGFYLLFKKLIGKQ